MAPRAIVSLLVFLATFGFPATAEAQESGTRSSETETVERILDLQRQIDELLDSLPPETREAVRQRLAKRPLPTPVPPSAPPVASQAPAPSPAPPRLPATAEPTPPAPTVAERAEPRPEPAQTAVAPPPEPAAPAEEPATAKPRRRLVRPHCNFLETFDENQDFRISALDRYWRHLNLWFDRNGDRQVQDNEVESTWDRNVREVAVDLETFGRKKDSLGEVWVDEYVVLDLRGDGLGGDDDAVLVVDATRLQRGTGPQMLSATGEILDGFQPLQAGQKIRMSEGAEAALHCP